MQDLLGFISFVNPVKQLRGDKGRTGITKALARLVLESFIDATGVDHPESGFMIKLCVREACMASLAGLAN